MNILEADSEKLLTAVRDLLAAKGLVSSAEISERIAITDAANPGQGARMVAKRAGSRTPVVLACTLLAYDPRFEMGTSLAEASESISLNHPFCASFCVLGGASCSR